MNKKTKDIVLSLGGSIMAPDGINEQFLRPFKKFILQKISLGYRFVIIVGGGKIARRYQESALRIGSASQEEQDWLGIEATKINALLLKTIFKEKAHPVLLEKRGLVKNFGRYSLVIGCGWEPGCSTDFGMVQTAVDFKIKKLVNLGKPDYVYTANPDKDKSAKPIEKITWQEYFKIIPKEWRPGMNAPFDPIAAKLAVKNKMEVVVAKGDDLPNFGKIIAEQKFKGTLIH